MDFETLKVSTRIKSVLVAGGAGFIGSHLVEHLLRQKSIQRVLVVDNFISGTIENLEGSRGDGKLEILEMDITDPGVIDGCEGGFDLVLHLAAIANPKDYERKPVETLRVNSQGSENLVTIAERNMAKFIFFSSSEVYGDQEPALTGSLEDASWSRIILNQKRSPYVVGKCFGEEITKNLCLDKGMDHLIIRPFNIYGPKMDMMTNYGRVIPNFCIWGLNGDPMRIHGDGEQIRSFCYVDDFINALISLLNSGVVGKSINIGNPDPISIIELAGLISDILGVEENFGFVERYPYEPFCRVPDISLIKKLTGWEPEMDLRSGLESTVKWFRETGLERYDRK